MTPTFTFSFVFGEGCFLVGKRVQTPPLNKPRLGAGFKQGHKTPGRIDPPGNPKVKTTLSKHGVTMSTVSIYKCSFSISRGEGGIY